MFAYIGDHPETEVFGLLFRANEPREVPEEVAVKLRNNRHFVEDIDGVQIVSEPKRRGRHPKAK